MSAGRPSAVQRAGLDANLTQNREGQWQIVLTDDTGNVVFDRTMRIRADQLEVEAKRLRVAAEALEEAP